MSTCTYEGCGVALPEPRGRGRPQKYCPEHAAAVKREQDAARRREAQQIKFARNLVTIFEEGSIPECCYQARLANHRAKACRQHSQFSAFMRDSRRYYSACPTVRKSEAGDESRTGRTRDQIRMLRADIYGSGHVTSNTPDSYWPDCHEDRAQDRRLRKLENTNLRDAALGEAA